MSDLLFDTQYQQERFSINDERPVDINIKLETPSGLDLSVHTKKYARISCGGRFKPAWLCNRIQTVQKQGMAYFPRPAQVPLQGHVGVGGVELRTGSCNPGSSFTLSSLADHFIATLFILEEGRHVSRVQHLKGTVQRKQRGAKLYISRFVLLRAVVASLQFCQKYSRHLEIC